MSRSPELGVTFSMSSNRRAEKMTYQEQLRAVIEDKQDTLALLKRLRRKVEILRHDLKFDGHRRTYDLDEMLSLLDILERKTRGSK